MKYSPEKREEIKSRFFEWTERVGYSGDQGVNIVIVDGLPVSVERAVQSIRFDVDLTNDTPNATME